MEFERLTRRELQTLCKKNKIPANVTNVAMTQALKSLSFVEGIDEFMQPSQSETAQSSVESPERKEVTSPHIPPTGGRTTRRRTAVKEGPETLPPMTRTTRCSTRKTLAADDTQTPLLVQTTATRRARVNSVCRKMDSQLKECEEEEKRNSLVTPAPSGVSTRRRRGMKEESVVKREYSTRRSVRLAAKKVDVPDLKADFFTKEGENVNVNFKESLDGVEETSGITGNTTVEKDFEQKEEIVVSAQKHYLQIGEGDDNATTVDTLEEIAESEDVQAERHAHTGKEIEHEAAFEGRTVRKPEVGDQKLDVSENLEENSEEEELEVVSAHKHGIQIGEVDSAVTVHNLEGKGEAEDVQPEENAHTDKEIEHVAAFEETVHKSEVDDQKLDGRSIDVNTVMDENLEENSEVEEEQELVSAQKHGIQIGEVDSAVTVHNLEGECEVECVQPEENVHTDKEIEQEAAFEEDMVQKSEVDDQKLDGKSNDVNTAVDENVEENSEDELEAVSAQKLHMNIGEQDDNSATIDNLEEKGESEDVQAEGHANTSKEIEQAAGFEEEIEQKFEVDNQKLEGDSIDVNTAVAENLEEKSEEEELEVVSAKKYYLQIGKEGNDNAATMDNLEGKGESEVVQAEEHAYTSKESEHAATSEKETRHKSEVDNQKLDEEIINVNTSVDNNSDKSAVGFLVDTEICNEMEEISADIDMEFKQLPPLNADEVVPKIQSNMHGDVAENELNLCKSPKSMVVEAKEHENDAVHPFTNSNEDVSTEISFAGSDSDLIIKPTCLTPVKISATKASPMMKSLTIVTDNKENIDSGSKIILPKVSAAEASPIMKRMTIMSDNKVAIAKNSDGNDKKYDDVSMRKLAKMLQRKLQITNKLSQNENENENEKEVCGGRLALKELPGNQLVNETHNN